MKRKKKTPDEESTDEENSDGQVAESDKEEGDDATTETEESADTNQVATTEGTAQESNSEVASALDEKLSEVIKENKDNVETDLVKALQDAGILDKITNEGLGSLSESEKAVLANAGNSEDVIKQAQDESNPLAAAIAASEVPTVPLETSSQFIQNLYSGLTLAERPFTSTNIDSIITQEEYNLFASHKLGMLVMPMDYSQNANGDLSFGFGEASVSSPTAVDNTYVTALAAGTVDMQINIRYSILNTSTQQLDEYDIQVPIDVAIITATDLLGEINNQLTSGNLNIYLNGSQINTFNDGTPYPISDITVALNSAGTDLSQFSIGSTAAVGTGTFITEIDVNFSGGDRTLLAEMMGGELESNDWHDQANIDLMITSGAWEISADGDGNPIIVIHDDEKNESVEILDENGLGTGVYENVIFDQYDVIKPSTNVTYNNSLNTFLECGVIGGACSIQVLKDDDKIRWGAWLSEPGAGINIHKLKEDVDGNFDIGVEIEDSTLAILVSR